MASSRSLSTIAAAFSRQAVSQLFPKIFRVPNTVVQILSAEEISQLEHRSIVGVANIRDYAMFWFPRDEPGRVDACREYSRIQKSEWSCVMSAKYQPKK